MLTGPSLGTNPELKIKPRYQPPGFNPANEIKVNNAMKTAYKYLDVCGKALGVISYIDHTNKGWQSIKNGDVWKGLGYYGLSVVDIAIILNKSTNPYVLASISAYDIIDVTAF